MIADKIFSCFNILEIEGEATLKVVPFDDIVKISASSKKYPNDLLALKDLDEIIKTLSSGSSNVKETFEINPEFLPGQKSENDADIQQLDNGSNKLMVEISRNFDDIGDYVEFRKIIETPFSLIKGRVLVNPADYAQAKADSFMREPGIYDKENFLH